jgi:hypothetical protein
MKKNTDSKMFSKRHFEKRLDALKIQMRSQSPSDILRVMEQIQVWLNYDIENKNIYDLLLDTIRENPSHREWAENIIKRMIEKGSKSASETLKALPVTIENLIADADDAYYAAEYGKAIELYKKALQLDSGNEHARKQLPKAEANRLDKINRKNTPPREAVKWYRQARSYIAANDIQGALAFLNAAVEASREQNIRFSDAEELLISMQSIVIPNDPFVPKLFISYSHRDEKIKDELITMLTPLQDQEILKIWQDREIIPGDEWYQSIQTAMNECNMALLLISGDFLASRFIRDEELSRLLQRRKEEGLRVVPIIVSDCLWKSVPVLKDLQALPKDGKSIDSCGGKGKRHQICAEVGEAIEKIIKQLRTEFKVQ